MASFYGTTGNDTFVGTSGDDAFDLSNGGEDTVSGRNGNDMFFLGAAFDAGDRIDGGGWSALGGDGIWLEGDYSAGLTLGASTLININYLLLNGPFAYDLTLHDGNIAAGQTLSVASNDDHGQPTSLHFNGSAETDGNQNVFATAFDDVIVTGAGDDLIKGNLGNDLIDGGPGINRADLSGGSSGVNVSLFLLGVPQATSAGVDTLVNIRHLTGTAFDDTLTGDDNANWLWGSGGSDTINGNGGDDLIQVGRLTAGAAMGTDVVDGGTGLNTLSFYRSQPATFSLQLQGVQQTTGADKIVATNFQNVTGSRLADNLTGDGNANVVCGDSGSDSVSGGAGDDMLFGDKGIRVNAENGQIALYEGTLPADDVLNGGDGDDVLDGGAGSDTAVLFSSAAVKANLAKGIAVGSLTGTDTLIAIENLSGGTGNDTLIGDGEANVLNGDAGQDKLLGGDGADTLQGRAGLDTLTGGTGADLFRYSPRDIDDGQADIIRDFVSGEDKFGVWVAVSGIAADVTTNKISHLAEAADASHLGYHEALIAHIRDHTYLVVETDGFAGYRVGSDLLVRIDGATSVALGDFVDLLPN